MSSEPTSSRALDAWATMRDALDLQRTQSTVLERLFGIDAEPTRIGRFIIERTAGQGEMGRVYAARDPELQRRVAVKLIRQFGDDESLAATRRTRLVREARAMAKIQHPNVIAVHEVSTREDDVFVVMEYVDGPSLRRWLQETSPGWEDVVRVFAGAARGLAAAHEQGVVHRDFKPDNVLVADGPRAIVLDFGLARPSRSDVSDAAPDDEDFDATVTRTGAVLGTPAYMAPEQMVGDAADARSDQYSFCVALFEALHGVRPFAADTLDDALKKIRAGNTPVVRSVPDWLARAVARGLRFEPSERHPSMKELVHELERRRISARTVGVLGLGALGVAGLGAWGATWWGDEPVRCEPGDARVAEVWGPSRASRLRQSFADSGLGYAPAVASRVSDSLDEYAASWASGIEQACVATHVRGEQSESMLDERMACLDRNLASLTAAVDVLLDADADVIERSPQIVGGLPSNGDCADALLLGDGRVRPRDPQARTAIAHADALVAKAATLRVAGQFDASNSVLDEAERALQEHEFGPTRARLLAARGLLLVDREDPEAERVLLDAVSVAEVHRQDAVAANCWRKLVRSTRGDQEADRRAAGYLERFEAAVGRIGNPPERLALLARARGYVDRRAGRYEDAASHWHEAIRIVEESGGKRDLVANTRVDLGAAFFLQGKYERAAREFERAAEVQAEVYGPDHPFTAKTVTNRGTCLVALGRNKEGIEVLASARDSVRRGLGPDHPSLALSTNAMASAHYQLGNFEEARDLYAEAVRSYETSLGADDPRLGPPLANLARTQSHLDQHDDAIAVAQRAVSIVETSKGEDHIEVATLLNGLGHVYTRAERYDEAQTVLRRALAIRQRVLGEDHVETAYSAQALADALRKLGRLDEALELAEQAHSTALEQLGDRHPQLGSILVTRGRIELDLGRKKAAQGHLQRAMEVYDVAEAPAKDVAQARDLLDRARRP